MLQPTILSFLMDETPELMHSLIFVPFFSAESIGFLINRWIWVEPRWQNCNHWDDGWFYSFHTVLNIWTYPTHIEFKLMNRRSVYSAVNIPIQLEDRLDLHLQSQSYDYFTTGFNPNFGPERLVTLCWKSKKRTDQLFIPANMGTYHHFLGDLVMICASLVEYFGGNGKNFPFTVHFPF